MISVKTLKLLSFCLLITSYDLIFLYLWQCQLLCGSQQYGDTENTSQHNQKVQVTNTNHTFTHFLRALLNYSTKVLDISFYVRDL